VRIPSLTAVVILSLLSTSAWAQFKKPGGDEGVALGESRVQKWQCGLVVSASGGACTGIVGYVPIPIDWPEQQVTVDEEDVSDGVRITYQTVDGTVKLMVVRVPYLAAGQEANALVTFEVRRSTIEAPANTEQYKIPGSRELDLRARLCLGESPKIETRHRKIRDLANEIGVDEPTAWEHVEAIYDWVRDKVEYKNGSLKGALAALEDGTGDCEELTSLFIAICRAAGIPARTVWVPGHCYPEFYLVDAEGEGHWFPCQAAGTRAFGEMPEFRPVLQKGDNFRPPWNRRDRQRYLVEHLTGTGGRPRVRFVRKMLND